MMCAALSVPLDVPVCNALTVVRLSWSGSFLFAAAAAAAGVATKSATPIGALTAEEDASKRAAAAEQYDAKVGAFLPARVPLSTPKLPVLAWRSRARFLFLSGSFR
jgi:hypothetical protein